MQKNGLVFAVLATVFLFSAFGCTGGIGEYYLLKKGIDKVTTYAAERAVEKGMEGMMQNTQTSTDMEIVQTGAKDVEVKETSATIVPEKTPEQLCKERGPEWKWVREKKTKKWLCIIPAK